MLLLFRVQGHQIPPGLSSCMAVMPSLSQETARREARGVQPGCEVERGDALRGCRCQGRCRVCGWACGAGAGQGPQLETEM